MIANESGSVVCGPKFIVPRQTRLTRNAVRPSRVYCMSCLLFAPLTARRGFPRSLGGSPTYDSGHNGAMADPVTETAALLRGARHVMALTGAGISTESGI